MEMLIVILIIVIMSSVMIPVMSSASDVRRAREGARVLSTMLASAQTQAQVSGRPAAVWIQRLRSSSGGSINAGAAMDIFLAEVPPPYLGDSLGATATVATYGGSSSTTVTFSGSGISQSANVQVGDLIRFNYRGEFYKLGAVGGTQSSGISGSTASITPLDQTLIGTAQAYPQPAPVPFQIYRRPIKSLASAVQLSDGVAVDLTNSGSDPNLSTSQFGQSFATTAGDTGAVIVTFSAAGALDMVYVVSSTSSTPNVFRPAAGVYFLIGRIENITPAAGSQPSGTTPNYQDMNSRWVAVGRQSGLVTTAEAASAASGATATAITSLRLAHTSQNAGGN